MSQHPIWVSRLALGGAALKLLVHTKIGERYQEFKIMNQLEFREWNNTYDLTKGYTNAEAFSSDTNRLLVLGVTTYDIHRSIEANETPPTEEQIAALMAQIEESRQSGESPKNSE